jgi:arylsulfatase
MLFFEHQGNRAVRSGKWKLVALDDQPWELYNFSVDRVEMNDLSNKHPQRVKRMAAAWDKWGEANQVTPLPRDLGVGYLKAD